jgi:DnaB-like helicase N terminal domain
MIDRRTLIATALAAALARPSYALPLELSPTSKLTLPPQDLGAEQALIGAMLADNKVYKCVSAIVASDDFADPVHGRIYAAMARRIGAGQIADVKALQAEFEGTLAEVGGTAYIAQLANGATNLDAAEWARVIHALARERRELDQHYWMDDTDILGTPVIRR